MADRSVRGAVRIMLGPDGFAGIEDERVAALAAAARDELARRAPALAISVVIQHPALGGPRATGTRGRCRRMISAAGIKTLGDLLRRNPEDLVAAHRGFGWKTMTVLARAAADLAGAAAPEEWRRGDDYYCAWTVAQTQASGAEVRAALGQLGYRRVLVYVDGHVRAWRGPRPARELDQRDAEGDPELAALLDAIGGEPEDPDVEACGYCGGDMDLDDGTLVYPHRERHCDDCVERCPDCQDQARDGE